MGAGGAGAVVADGRWHHLAGCVSGSRWALYVDGLLASEATVAAGPVRTTAPLLLGADWAAGAPALAFDGELDEVRLWNVARGTDELRAALCHGLPDFSAARPANRLPALVAYYADLTTHNGGSIAGPAVLINFNNGARRISAAPLGTASVGQYAPARPGGLRLEWGGGPAADSVRVSGFAPGTKGAHLYRLGGGYGVFTIGQPLLVVPLPGSAFVVRYRPGGMPACYDLLRRTMPPSPAVNTGARLTPDGRALHLPVQHYRSDFFLSAAVPFFAYVEGDAALCPGAVATLHALTTARARYRWSTGDTTETIRVRETGHFSVVCRSLTGCPPQQASWEVRPAEVLMPFSFGADTTICTGTSLTLAGPTGNFLRYEWQDALLERRRPVTEAGTYTLSVESDCGQQHTASIRVAVQDCFRVPTIITPNGDGRNDRFVVQENTPATWELQVHNRWGSLVFSTLNYQHDWGPTAAPGLYYVLLRRPADGYTYKGWLEVLR